MKNLVPGQPGQGHMTVDALVFETHRGASVQTDRSSCCVLSPSLPLLSFLFLFLFLLFFLRFLFQDCRASSSLLRCLPPSLQEPSGNKKSSASYRYKSPPSQTERIPRGTLSGSDCLSLLVPSKMGLDLNKSRYFPREVAKKEKKRERKARPHINLTP